MSDSETIKQKFSLPIIPREPGLRHLLKINDVHKKGKASAASVFSTLGGGAHGLLGLGLLLSTYFQITEMIFHRSANPGLLPQNVISMSAQMAKIVRQHKEELRVYRLVVAADLALKSQLIDAFKEIYFSGLRNRHTGFTGISYMNMVTHLYTKYGIISAVDIMENEKPMDTLYDPSIAIEAFFEQIESAV